MAVQTTTTANNADDDNNDTIVNEEGKEPELVEVQTPVQLLTLSDLFYISGQEGKIATTTTATPTPTTTTTTTTTTTATTTAATTATATTAKRRTVQSLSSFRNHKVWQAESVWEAALKKRVVQRLTELREGEPDHDTKRQVAFSCLSVFAHTMALGFALPVTMVQAFILKHAVELDLSGEQMAVLGRLDCLRETTSKTNTTGSSSSS
jgi:hypothetical protein